MRTGLRSAVSIGVGAALLVVGTAGTSAASPPDPRGSHLVSDRFTDHSSVSSTELGPEDWPCSTLGFAVRIDTDISGVEMLTPRGRTGIPYDTQTVHGTVSYSANGHTYRHTFAVVTKDQRITLDGDILTIVGQGAGKDTWTVDGQRTFFNPGMVRFSVMVDDSGTPQDPFDDVEVPGSFQIVKDSTGVDNGPTGDFCTDLATFLAA